MLCSVCCEPFGATTHTDLVVRAKKMGVEVKVIHNASVMNAIGVYIRVKEPTFESLCRGGKKVYEPPRFMTVNTAISQLLEVEEAHGESGRILNLFSFNALWLIFYNDMFSAYTKDTLCIGVARLGSDDQRIVAGPMEKLLDVDFGPPLHCLIIVGKTHPLEEEMIEFYMIK
ncbi:hypothetical protein PR202_ga25732 [Eleusine coracana subsp. coracana]|uniref:Diphthine methyl ester synthase n=1 Tax=Eleusine coracana subsp. coracana TaxID=191504 RepID=A0AAV5DC47_ELECO|nr:hypothetical protein PR202_ga25732 [Eleusine coracana subsp. coracana]